MNVEMGPGDRARLLKSAVPKDCARNIGVNRVAEARHQSLEPKVEPFRPGRQRRRSVGVAGRVLGRGHVHLGERLP